MRGGLKLPKMLLIGLCTCGAVTAQDYQARPLRSWYRSRRAD